MSTRRKTPSRDPRKNPIAAYRAAYRCGHCPGRLRDGQDGWGVYHEAGCPVLAGVVDPGAAGRRAAAEASEQTGIPVTHGSWRDAADEATAAVLPGGPARPRATAVINRTIGRLGSLRECPHLHKDQRAFMVAHRPDIILCTACWVAEGQRTMGTREDATCDYCGQYQPTAGGGPYMYGTYSEPFPGVSFQVHFGLCAACWDADRAEAP